MENEKTETSVEVSELENQSDNLSESQEDELMHYGTPRHSGRYPWGSGDDPYQHSGDFLSRVDELKKSGMTEKEIGDAIGLSTTQLRAQISLASNERRSLQVAQAKSLKEDGLSNIQIAEKMGLKGESTVRSLLNSDSEARMKIAEKTANNLKLLVDEKGMIDVGTGTERQLKVSKEKMAQALEILKLEGYEVYNNRVPQATNAGKFTTLKVLCPPGTEHKEIYNYDQIHSIEEYTSRDGGDTFEKSFVYPASMDGSRIFVKYREDGGSDKDGLVEIRRGVKDLSLGEANYAQVRILVDGTHYVKGMAVYSDDIPEGYDLLINSNKAKAKGLYGSLKEIKSDPDNPFGATIKENGGQSYYTDENGERKLSLINKKSDEGDWGEWSHELPSQFLSKQPLYLIKKQLGLAETEKVDEFNEIMSLTNPTVKRALLNDFADDCDSASIQLKAAAFPGQTYKVILPVTSLKDNEVYSPHLEDGSQVALIRYPHGGTFEIPILTVNNRNKESISMIGKNPADAIAINSKVAERLSGADFDGDTVMVIPLSDKVKVNSTPKLKELEGFDTKLAYGADESYKDSNGKEHYIRGGKEFKIMNNTQTEMGKISNLITDMTLKGATQDELARAVKHSMVVIDAEKHKLDYKQSEIDNNIDQLKKDYQGHKTDNKYGGASTLISKAKSKLIINERKEGAFYTKEGNEEVTLIDNSIYVNKKTGEVLNKKDVKTVYVDPKTGEKLYHDTNREYKKVTVIQSNGKKKEVPGIVKDNNIFYKGEDGKYVRVTDEVVTTKKATQNSTKMEEVKDARILSSGTQQEEYYANYANKMKSLANTARKEALIIDDIPYSATAKEIYKDQVNSLDYQYNQYQLNKPRERQAQMITASVIKAKKQEDPSMSSEHEKKLKQQELTKARQKVGAKRTEIKLTDKEWEAIQAGAISPTKLKSIIECCDSGRLKELAMPRNTTTISSTKLARMKNMANSGYTTDEIARSLGISSSSVIKYLKGKE